MDLTRHSQRAWLLSVCLVAAASAPAQCTLTSATGYTVHLSVRPSAILPSSTSCPNGYSYRVRLGYAVTFTGTNIPDSLYTLQGTIGCTGAPAGFFDLPNSGGGGSVNTSDIWRNAGDCGSATVASIGCNTVAIEIAGPGLSERTISCAYTTLPIILLHLDAVEEGDRVRVSWTTATEADNAGFFVEHAGPDGVFRTTAWVDGAGNSQHAIHYSAVDEQPYPGLSYYRLKQVNADGDGEYSDIVVVERTLNTSAALVSPNPNPTDAFSLSVDAVGGTLTIMSITGQVLWSTVVTTQVMEHPPLPPGLYVVRLTDATGLRQRSTKLVQQ